MPAFSPVRRSARGAARVVPFDPVAEALRPQSAHKVKKPKAFYIESVMEIRKTQYHEEFGTNNGGFCKVMMREGEMAVVKDSTQRRPSATAATAGRQVTSPDGTRAFPLSPTSKHLSVRIAYAINSADSGRRRGADRRQARQAVRFRPGVHIAPNVVGESDDLVQILPRVRQRPFVRVGLIPHRWPFPVADWFQQPRLDLVHGKPRHGNIARELVKPSGAVLA